jgi:hypothetical protein
VRRDGHRFQRIAEQVDQDLLNLDPVGKHQIARRVQVEAQKHALFAGGWWPGRMCGKRGEWVLLSGVTRHLATESRRCAFLSR